jgi:hypothetical protein
MTDESVDDLLGDVATEEAGPRLGMFVSAEVERILAVVRADATDTHYKDEEIGPRAEALYAVTEPLARMSAAAGYWAPSSTARLWSGAFAALMPGQRTGGVAARWEQLAIYPAALVAYSLGIGASAARHYDHLASLFTTQVPNERNEWRPLVELVHPYAVDERTGVHLREARSKLTPFSDHLHAVVRPLFRELLPRDGHFEREFDRFELLLALAYYQLLGGKGADTWVPLGRVRRLGRYNENASRQILEEPGHPAQPTAELQRLMGCALESIDDTTAGFHAAVAKQLSQIIFAG